MDQSEKLLIAAIKRGCCVNYEKRIIKESFHFASGTLELVFWIKVVDIQYETETNRLTPSRFPMETYQFSWKLSTGSMV